VTETAAATEAVTADTTGLWDDSPTIRELEAESRGVQEWLPAENCITGALIDACGLAAIMPEEDPESLEGVRSQRRRYLPSVD
jgi:hypothetical protein